MKELTRIAGATTWHVKVMRLRNGEVYCRSMQEKRRREDNHANDKPVEKPITHAHEDITDKAHGKALISWGGNKKSIEEGKGEPIPFLVV